jgi:hypothetical protein
MNANTNGGSRAGHTAGPNGDWPLGPVICDPTKKHFDTFETTFFEQGDDASTLPAVFDGDDTDGRRHHYGPLVGRSTLAGLVLLSTSVAVIACVALAKSTARLTEAPPAMGDREPAAPAPAPAVAATSEPTPPPAAAIAANEPAPSPVAVAANEPAPAVGAASEPTPAPAVVAANQPAAPSPTPAPTMAVPPAAAEHAPNPAAEAAQAAPEAAAASPVAAEGERCKQAIRAKRNREIVSACTTAFAEQADAEIALALARVEFDRGRFSQANTWSKKAIALNPDSAEAYVFAGGAEQSQGHGKAAKEAYLRYLRLAPNGRYAAEVRSILRSL